MTELFVYLFCSNRNAVPVEEEKNIFRLASHVVYSNPKRELSPRHHRKLQIKKMIYGDYKEAY